MLDRTEYIPPGERWPMEIACDGTCGGSHGTHLRCGVCGDALWKCRYGQRSQTIITLCGSTRFKDAINVVNAKLTMKGNLVISLGVFGHVDMPDHDWTTGSNADKLMLDNLHKRKIDLADRICVVSVGGYIGDSTRGEIAYAVAHGKPVDYWDFPEGAFPGV